MPIGMDRDNPGNIEAVPASMKFNGVIKPHDGSRYLAFDALTNGIRAIAINLLSYYDKHGIDTIREAITRWAPPGKKDKNPTNAYITNVAKWADLDPDMPLDFHDKDVMFGLVRGICWQENGQGCVTDEQVRAGIRAAGFAAVKPLKQSTTIKAANVGTVATVTTLAAGTAQQAADTITPLLPAIQAVHSIWDSIRPMLPFVIGIGAVAVIGALIYIKIQRARMHEEGVV